MLDIEERAADMRSNFDLFVDSVVAPGDEGFLTVSLTNALTRSQTD